MDPDRSRTQTTNAYFKKEKKFCRPRRRTDIFSTGTLHHDWPHGSYEVRLY